MHHLRGFDKASLNFPLDLTSIPSRIGGAAGGGDGSSVFSYKQSVLTFEKAQSLLGYGLSNRYPTSNKSGKSSLYPITN